MNSNLTKLGIEHIGVFLEGFKKNTNKTILDWFDKVNQEGDKEELERLIQMGADLNIQDKDGYTPLMLSTVCDSNELVDFFINAGAKLDLQNNDGDTALIIAANSGNCSLLEILLKAGANPSIQDRKGKTAIILAAFQGHNKAVELLLNTEIRLYGNLHPHSKKYKLPLHLKSMRAENFQNLFNSIAKKRGRLFCEFKETSLIKALAHATDLNGFYSPPPLNPLLPKFQVNLEGGDSFIWYHKMAKATALLQAKQPANTLYETLKEALAFSANINTETPSTILKRIQNNLPTILDTSLIGHTASVLIWENYFILGNTGYASRWPVECFLYDKNSLKEEHIAAIISHTNKSKKEYKQLFFKDLPQQLQFKKGFSIEIMQDSCNIPDQEVGNCSWRSPIATIWNLFVLHKTRYFLNALMTIETKRARKIFKPIIRDTINDITKEFQSWLVFNQLYHLERYMGIYQLRKPKPNTNLRPYQLELDLIEKGFKGSFKISNNEIHPTIVQERQTLYSQAKHLQISSLIHHL